MIINWYHGDGFIQFLLGGQIGQPSWRVTGVLPQMIFAWIGVLMAAFIILTYTAAHANPISDIPRGRAHSDLKFKLAEGSEYNYTTIKLLLKSGMRAYDYLAEVPDSEPHETILARLKEEYYPSFSTIKLLYRQEVRAWRELTDE